MSHEKKEDFSDFQSPHEASVERLVAALDRAYHNPRQLMWRSFLQGFMSAIGVTIGTIFILGLVGLLLHELGGIKLLAPLVDRIQNSVVQGVTTQENQIQQQLKTIASPTPSPTPSSPSL